MQSFSHPSHLHPSPPTLTDLSVPLSGIISGNGS